MVDPGHRLLNSNNTVEQSSIESLAYGQLALHGLDPGPRKVGLRDL